MSKQRLYSEQIQECLDAYETAYGTVETIHNVIVARGRREKIKSRRRLPKGLVETKVLVKVEKDLRRMYTMLEAAKHAERIMKLHYRLP